MHNFESCNVNESFFHCFFPPSSPEHKTFVLGLFWTSEFKGMVHPTTVEQFQPFVAKNLADGI